jgi:hypothetical protein
MHRTTDLHVSPETRGTELGLNTLPAIIVNLFALILTLPTYIYMSTFLMYENHMSCIHNLPLYTASHCQSILTLSSA